MNPPAVRFRDVSIRYGGHGAVEGVSFSLPEGAMLAIVGPNGAGKSTILKAMLGLVRPWRGTIELFGCKQADLPTRTIAYVPQVKTHDPRFPALSIEVVVTGLTQRWPGRIPAEAKAKALEALAHVGATSLATRPIRELSGGEMQRVYLARSLVSEPRLILLDEPLTGIDAVGEEDFYRLLEKYRDQMGATLFIVTHDWQVASYHSSHVLLLNHRPVSFGPPSAALGEECLREAYGHLGHIHDRLRTKRESDGA